MNKPNDDERGINPEDRAARDREAAEGPLPRKPQNAASGGRSKQAKEGERDNA